MEVEGSVVLQNYEEVISKITQTCLQMNRPANSVKLIVISKFQPEEKIRCLLEAGHRDFGESRIDEVMSKWGPLLADFPNTKLHFIGSIQSRKVRDIVKYCDYVHSVDRYDIADRIARECQIQNKSIDCFIQVNVGAEPQKSGIDISEFSAFLEKCRANSHLSIIGAMCLPPADHDPAPYFQLMQDLQMNNHLKELSMGMSNDYVEAIAHGATMIRVGSKILGSRSI
jgi:pyridoxal phosphate enzyme (YggS family)